VLTAALFCAQAQVITTIAGTDFTFPTTPLLAVNAPTGAITSVVVDSSGIVYVADVGNNLVFRLDRSGLLTTVAGNGTYGFAGDGGLATSAALASVRGVAVDALGNLFIADIGNNRVRKVDLAGVISTVAGNGAAGYSGDGGPATNAS
jgi:sugar lactone lactonase YvrE